jgi:hypothetical protein
MLNFLEFLTRKKDEECLVMETWTFGWRIQLW